jgi:hypothetical protein
MDFRIVVCFINMSGVPKGDDIEVSGIRFAGCKLTGCADVTIPDSRFPTNAKTSFFVMRPFKPVPCT